MLNIGFYEIMLNCVREGNKSGVCVCVWNYKYDPNFKSLHGDGDRAGPFFFLFLSLLLLLLLLFFE